MADPAAEPEPQRRGLPPVPGAPDERWLVDRAARAVAVLMVLAVLAVLIAYGSAGLAGLVISLSAVGVGGLLVAAIGLPGPLRLTRPPRRLPSFDEPYPTFARVSEQLSWSQVSPRHYDLMTRPLLVRLLATRLADHHGLDLTRDREAARALVGEEVWWWVDPERPAESSSQPPGTDVAVLSKVVARLEQL